MGVERTIVPDVRCECTGEDVFLCGDIRVPFAGRGVVFFVSIDDSHEPLLVLVVLGRHCCG